MSADPMRPAAGRPGMRSTPLIRAKLRPPSVPVHYVRRARLLQLLDAAIAAPLVLVVAPAGGGKTSLLAGWVEESPLPTAWLSADEADGDPVQLWTDLFAALEMVAPGCSDQARLSLRGRSTVAEAVGRLLDELDVRQNPPSVLAIDDAHVIDGDAAVASLALFIQHLPAWLHVILVSRRTPVLPLDRLRARGQLGEVHFAELRFSRHEARELLGQLAPSLSDEDVDLAVATADGWAASLQLTALAARSARARDAEDVRAMDDRTHVRDYIVHEVLAAESPDVVEVLSDVSVVERVNPGLAVALTGRSDAGALLAAAEARGLFVSRVPGENWFELHSLVRAALGTELASHGPRHVAERHRRAAAWYEDADETTLALDHWLLGGEPRSALRLLAAKHAELYDAGHEEIVLRTISAIPERVATDDLASMLEYTWCHLLVDRRRFLELVAQVTWWSKTTALDATTRARVTMLQSMAATVNGNWADGGSLARQVTRDLDDAWLQDPLGRFAWNLVARDVALSERWDDSVDEVRRAEAAVSRDPERRIAFEGTRAVGEALAGRPVDALRVAAGVRRVSEVTKMTILRAELALAEGIAHRELGDRPRAAAELTALATAPAETMIYCRVLAALEVAQMHLDEGDVPRARQAFDQITRLVDEESFGTDGRNWLARVGTRVALAADDAEEARRWCAQLSDPFWQQVSMARVHLADGHLSAARDGLDTAVARCPRHEVVLALVRAQAVEDHDESLKLVTTAVEQAVAAGLLQTVASEGPDMAQLVERAAWRAPRLWMDRFRRAVVPGSLTAPIVITGTETLTARERDVLRFLASRLTLREIASELYVSVNTLKFHLKVIYRKLGVSSRSEAAEVARRMTAVHQAASSPE